MNARSVPLSLPLVDEKGRVGGNASAGDAAIAATPIIPSGRERGRRIAPSGAKHDHPPASSPLLLALPVDSLHCIASFLRPGEWSNLGQAGRGAGHACREVFRRVRMHGFRCATEIITAWVSLDLNYCRHCMHSSLENIHHALMDRHFLLVHTGID